MAKKRNIYRTLINLVKKRNYLVGKENNDKFEKYIIHIHDLDFEILVWKIQIDEPESWLYALYSTNTDDTLLVDDQKISSILNAVKRIEQ